MISTGHPACFSTSEETSAGAQRRLAAEGSLPVRDHGPGFPTADLPRVFERFYRSPEARGKPGSGLGLAIVRQVAQMHGATAMASNADDGGGVITVAFPIPG